MLPSYEADPKSRSSPYTLSYNRKQTKKGKPSVNAYMWLPIALCLSYSSGLVECEVKTSILKELTIIYAL